MKISRVLPLLFLSLVLTSCGVETSVDTKTPYEIEVVKVTNLSKEVSLQKSALMKAGTQVTLTAQSSGRIGSIFVKPGESVVAGEVLAQIDDTYGTANNAREEAAIALETSRLTLASTTASLDQSLASAKIAYEKAQKDHEASIISGTPDEVTGKSKAQLDYENYITTQERTLAGYETTYQSQLQSFQSFLANVIDTTDTLVGVSDSKKNLNDNFEYLLGALDETQRGKTELSIKKLLPYKVWSPNQKLSLIDRVLELQNVYLIANEVLTNTENLLINSVSDATNFPNATLATYRATIDGYQSQYSGISTGLVSYLNAAQTFLATYEKERLSREKTIATTEENSQDTLTLAKNAYETATKTRDITLRQMNQNIASASVRLRNAGGNVSRLSITAPVDGVVGKITVDVGEEVTNGRAIMDIASRDAECDITVDSATLAQIQVGTKVVVNYRGQGLPGQIMSISPIADTGLNFAVKIGVNADVTVFGDFATIDMPLTSAFTTLPITAVTILAPGQGEVWIAHTDENGNVTVEKKNVILGNLWGNTVEITSELLPTDEIVLSDMKNYNPLDFILQKKEKILTQPL